MTVLCGQDCGRSVRLYGDLDNWGLELELDVLCGVVDIDETDSGAVGAGSIHSDDIYEKVGLVPGPSIQTIWKT